MTEWSSSKILNEYDNSNNNGIVAITDLLECPICPNNIYDTDDSYYIMECCKNKVHLKCLTEWYKSHQKLKTCFICNQYNSFSENFVMSYISQNSNIQENNITASIQTVNNVIQENNYQNGNSKLSFIKNFCYKIFKCFRIGDT